VFDCVLRGAYCLHGGHLSACCFSLLRRRRRYLFTSSAANDVISVAASFCDRSLYIAAARASRRWKFFYFLIVWVIKNLFIDLRYFAQNMNLLYKLSLSPMKDFLFLQFY